MEKMEFEISETDGSCRLDKYLTLKLGEDYSRTYVKFLIDNGSVLVNQEKVKPKYSVRTGDKIFVTLRALPEAEHIKPENIPLNIIYEDSSIVVVEKACGMIVHPGAGNKSGTLVNALLYHTKNLAEADDILRPGIVHRLDKDTTGVMVVAKNSKALRSLAKQFQERTVKKNYLALVKGRIEVDNGNIVAPIARHKENRQKMRVDYDAGKPARTVYHVLKRFKGFTFLRLDLFTGRTHQIRVHMKHIGHPVLGDLRYGGDPRVSRQALHAERLGFHHPDTGKYVEFVSPMPEDMRKLVEKGEL